MSLPTLLMAEGINLAGYTDEQLGREGLRQSVLRDLLACPRKFELHWEQRLETISKRKPLELGAAFQKSVEFGDPEAGARMLREHRRPLSQEDEDKLRIDETLIRVASALYLVRWPQTADSKTEFEFRVRLRNPWTGHYSRTFDLLGHVDGLEDEGGFWSVIENKFVGSLTPVMIRKVTLDRQVAIYTYGVWRATGQRVRVVRYRHIRKPSIKQRQNESIDEFCARLEQDYIDRPEFYSNEEVIFRTDDDLTRIEAELWTWAEQIRHARKQRIFPRNTSTCFEYGGCDFIPICVGDPDAMSLYHTGDG